MKATRFPSVGYAPSGVDGCGLNPNLIHVGKGAERVVLN